MVFIKKVRCYTYYVFALLLWILWLVYPPVGYNIFTRVHMDTPPTSNHCYFQTWHELLKPKTIINIGPHALWACRVLWIHLGVNACPCATHFSQNWLISFFGYFTFTFKSDKAKFFGKILVLMFLPVPKMT